MSARAALDVECPFCKASPGEWCRRIEWFRREMGRARLLHPSRIRALRAAERGEKEKGNE